MCRPTRRLALLALLVPAASLVFARCTTPTPTSVPAATACAASASARCDQISRCAPLSFQANYGGNSSTCVAIFNASCLTNLQVPDNTNTPALLLQCAQDLPQASCESYFLNSPPASCVAPAGVRASDRSCGLSGQCASGVCLTSKLSSCGICESQPSAGATCTTYGCGNGLVCDTDGGTCILPSYTAGTSCLDSAQCGAGFSCNGGAGQRTCVLLKTSVGANCDVATDGGPCSATTADLFCDTKGAHTCQKYAWADAGAVCGYLGAGLQVRCASGGTCVATDGGTSICVAAAEVGGNCDTVAGPACLAPARCILSDVDGTGGTCQDPDPASCK